MDSKKAYKILKTARGQSKFLRDIWGKFNAYADKNEWVRPAATAAAAGLGGAGLGALLGGGKGAAIGGLTGLIGGGTGGAIWDDMRHAQLQRNRYTPDKFIAANLDNVSKNMAMTKRLPEDPQQRAIQLQRMKTNFVRNAPKYDDYIKKPSLDAISVGILRGFGKNTTQFMVDPAGYIRNIRDNVKAMPKNMPRVKAYANNINKYLYNMFNLSPQEFKQYEEMLYNQRMK